MYRVEIWSLSTVRADLLYLGAGLAAAQAVFARAKQDRRRGEIVRLSHNGQIVAEVADADAIPVMPTEAKSDE